MMLTSRIAGVVLVIPLFAGPARAADIVVNDPRYNVLEGLLAGTAQ